MRIVLRSVADGRFLASDQEKRWTSFTQDALAFKRSQDAVKMASKMKLDLSQLELVFKNNHSEDMIIRLHQHGSSVVRRDLN